VNLPISEKDAKQIQHELAARVLCHDDWAQLRFVAGVSFRPLNETAACAAICVLDLTTFRTTDSRTATTETHGHYTSGLRAFQEGPAIIAAFEKLRTTPDVIMFNGHGIAHPRRCGLASHLGLVLNVPSIGVSEQLLFGNYDSSRLANERGAHVPVIDPTDNKDIAVAVRTRSNVRPIYVSIGHRVSLATAMSMVLQCSPKYRMPEPLRQARMSAAVISDACRSSRPTGN